jgi:predicted PilT family ATPase
MTIPKKIELGLKHHSGSVQNILMSEPKQIIAITRSGGTSIIRGNEKTGQVSVYIYIGNGEDEYAYSALVLPKGEVKFCKDNTSTVNLNQTTNNNTNLNIWNLNDEKITTEFDLSGNNAEQSKQSLKIWSSWPRP